MTMLSNRAQSLGLDTETLTFVLPPNPERNAMPMSQNRRSDSLHFQHIAEQRTGPGIMILNSAGRLVYQDSEARTLCKELYIFDAPERKPMLPRRVIAVFNKVKSQMRRRTHVKDWEQFRVKALVSCSPRPFLITGFGLPNHENPQHTQVLVTIEVLGRRKQGILQQTKECFRPTEREGTVVQQLLNGWTNKQIGSSLGVREQTVKEHIKHIMEKTSTSTRTGIIVQLLRP